MIRPAGARRREKDMACNQQMLQNSSIILRQYRYPIPIMMAHYPFLATRLSSLIMMNAITWLSLLIALSVSTPALFVGAFGVRPDATRSYDMTSSSSCLGMMSSPTSSGSGGWENDDFLESLSGNSGGGAAGNLMNTGGNASEEEPVERNVPENNMTDEEITMMAMRAAQFYNTDKTIQEAYGVLRSGPPRKKDEDESDFQ